MTLIELGRELDTRSISSLRSETSTTTTSFQQEHHDARSMLGLYGESDTMVSSHAVLVHRMRFSSLRATDLPPPNIRHKKNITGLYYKTSLNLANPPHVKAKTTLAECLAEALKLLDEIGSTKRTMINPTTAVVGWMKKIGKKGYRTRFDK